MSKEAFDELMIVYYDTSGFISYAIIRMILVRPCFVFQRIEAPFRFQQLLPCCKFHDILATFCRTVLNSIFNLIFLPTLLFGVIFFKFKSF